MTTTTTGDITIIARVCVRALLLNIRSVNLQNYQTWYPDLLRRGSGAGRGRSWPSSYDRTSDDGSPQCPRGRHAAWDRCHCVVLLEVGVAHVLCRPRIRPAALTSAPHSTTHPPAASRTSHLAPRARVAERDRPLSNHVTSIQWTPRHFDDLTSFRWIHIISMNSRHFDGHTSFRWTHVITMIPRQYDAPIL